MQDTLQINTVVNLLKQEPQQQVIQILNNLLLLLPTNYQAGNRFIQKIMNELPDDTSVENLFQIYNELLVSDSNTIILYSKTPFYLRINETNEILENIYNFTYTASKAIDLYVANLSVETDNTINYIIANTNLLGSSYVYS